MAAPTRQQALTVLVFVGVAAISLIVMSVTISFSAKTLGYTPGVFVQEALSVIVALGGGTLAAYKYRDKGGT